MLQIQTHHLLAFFLKPDPADQMSSINRQITAAPAKLALIICNKISDIYSGEQGDKDAFPLKARYYRHQEFHHSERKT